MSKPKKPRDRRVFARLARELDLNDLREGRRQRAVTFPNKKAVADKARCRDDKGERWDVV